MAAILPVKARFETKKIKELYSENTNYLVTVESHILLKSLISVPHPPATVQSFKIGLKEEEA